MSIPENNPAAEPAAESSEAVDTIPMTLNDPASPILVSSSGVTVCEPHPRGSTSKIRGSNIHQLRLDRFLGAVLGAAIGDALGYPVEFVRSYEGIRSSFGPSGVTGFVRHLADGSAPYSDDTQMSEQVLLTFAERATHDYSSWRSDINSAMTLMAEKFIRWSTHPIGGHRAPGGACMSACHSLANGAPWYEGGSVTTGGGCGSVMRVYPVGLTFKHEADVITWARAQSSLTHRHPFALTACAAFANAVRVAYEGGSPDLVADAALRVAAYSPDEGEPLFHALAGNQTSFVETVLAERGNDRAQKATAFDLLYFAVLAERFGIPHEQVYNRLHGWNAKEAAAAGLYGYLRNPFDARAALLETANTPGDSDTLASLTGALVGVTNGLSGLPAELVEGVERSVDLQRISSEAYSRLTV